MLVIKHHPGLRAILRTRLHKIKMTQLNPRFVLLSNTLANLLGKISTTLSGVILTPLQLRAFGNEAFGVVTACNTFNTILTLLDFGLSRAIQVDVARSNVRKEGKTHSSLFSIGEVCYWTLALLGYILLWLLSPRLASGWLRSSSISADELTTIIRLCCIQFFFSFPISLYIGALSALEKQVAANVALSLGALVRVSVGFYILTRGTPRLSDLLLANLFATVVTCAILFTLARKYFEYQGFVRHLGITLLPKLKLAGGIAVISFLNIVTSQADRLVATGMLTLDQLASLGIATSFSLIPVSLGTSINSAFGPRSVTAAATQSKKETATLYKRATILSAAVIAPVSAVVIAFSPQLVDIWTERHSMAAQTAYLIGLTVAGSALATASYLIVSLQYAYGNTTIGSIVNLVTLAVSPLITYFGIVTFGLPGAALGSIVSAAVQFSLNHVLTFRFILDGETRWDYYSILLSIVCIVCVVTSFGKFFITSLQLRPILVPAAMIIVVLLNGLCVLPVILRFPLAIGRYSRT